MKLPLFRKNQILVKKFNNEENNSSVALLSFNGKIRDQIIERFNTNFSVNGSHIKDGGKSSPKSILTLISAGAGSTGLAGLASGQLFMATANPATLMAIGNGVGSAVMGAGGIVAQAPFIPVAGALMPVVAPLIAFQVFSTMTIMNEFKIVNKKLDEIISLVETIIRRDEATNLGIIISALNRVIDIENQYNVLKYFNYDMMNRLALLENSINPLFERYKCLYISTNNSIKTNEVEYSDLKDFFGEMVFDRFYSLYIENRPKEKVTIAENDLKYKGNDDYFAIISSIVDIKISLLRIKLNMQEAPEYVENSTFRFIEKVKVYEKLWINIQKDYERIEEISTRMTEAVNSMNWWQQNMPSWLGGKREVYIDNNTTIKQLTPVKDIYNSENGFRQTLEQSLESIQDIKQTEQEANSNLWYWKDDLGEHSYFTDDKVFEVVNAKK